MRLISSAFESGGVIPKRYTCDGDDVSPPLMISGIPKEARSLALIVDDPDVPRNIRADGLWVHWVMWNIDPKTATIAEGAVPEGVMAGIGTGGGTGYAGPCPPDREHRYFFRLFALDTILDIPKGATKETLEEAMRGHMLETAELVGRYDRR